MEILMIIAIFVFLSRLNNEAVGGGNRDITEGPIGPNYIDFQEFDNRMDEITQMEDEGYREDLRMRYFLYEDTHCLALSELF
ncbi:hypothetical protein [Celeribacter halophilus]|uniref:hypothetical protein n=1 Tax=Celeribacter halophilus TaxID=576117 RepID=UPI002FD0402B